jgi:uncharacterized protein (DUF4415 family)
MPDRTRRRILDSATRRGSTKRAEVSTTGHRTGDKVRVKSGAHAGVRAILGKVASNLLVVVIDSTETVMLAPDALTNYSLAARKAWAIMPKRAGRPVSTHPPKRMVSLRLDPDLLCRLDEAVRMGAVENRSQGISALVNAGLDRLSVPIPRRLSTDLPISTNVRRLSRG